MRVNAAPSVRDICGVGVAVCIATICIGLDAFASYFVMGILYLQILTFFIVFIGTVLSIPINVRYATLGRLAPLMLWIVFMALLIIGPQLGTRGEKYGYAVQMFVSTTLILLSGFLFVVLMIHRPSLGPLATFVFIVSFIVAAAAVMVDPILDIRSRVPTFNIDLYERSRAGGFFLQPNIAAAALPLLFLTIAPRVSRGTNTILAVLLVLAVALTFSRAGLLTTLLVLSVTFFSGRLSTWTIAVALFFALLFGGVIDIPQLLIENFDISGGSGFNRLTNLDQFVTLQAASEDSRASLALTAFFDFLREPWFGMGPGYSWEWADSQPDQVGTHNIFLRYMLEYGILGALIWPSLMIGLYHLRDHSLPRYWAVTIFSTSLLIGLFSHNLTEQGVILMTILAAYVLPVPASLQARVSRKSGS